MAKRGSCEQRPLAAQDVETLLLERLGAFLGTESSAFLVQQKIEEVRIHSGTREVGVTLRDGSRFTFGLPFPVRPGCRNAGGSLNSGRVPRVSRLMALAIRFENLVSEGKLEDYASVAGVGQISRARMSQMLKSIARGKISPTEAESISKLLNDKLRIIEVANFEARIAELESTSATNTQNRGAE